MRVFSPVRNRRVIWKFTGLLAGRVDETRTESFRRLFAGAVTRFIALWSFLAWTSPDSVVIPGNIRRRASSSAHPLISIIAQYSSVIFNFFSRSTRIILATTLFGQFHKLLLCLMLMSKSAFGMGRQILKHKTIWQILEHFKTEHALFKRQTVLHKIAYSRSCVSVREKLGGGMWHRVSY